MGTTSNRGYRYPASTDNVQIWSQIQNAATDVDTDVQALYASRGAWTANVPTWNTGGSIGNATVAGSYVTQGKTCSFTLEIIWGSTTTPGTVAWLFNLPGGPASATSPGYSFCGHLIDTSTSTHRIVAVHLDNSARVILYLDAASAAIPGASGTAPWTWATGDIVRITGTYQLA